MAHETLYIRPGEHTPKGELLPRGAGGRRSGLNLGTCDRMNHRGQGDLAALAQAGDEPGNRNLAFFVLGSVLSK
jgi:hypothetical protein